MYICSWYFYSPVTVYVRKVLTIWVSSEPSLKKNTPSPRLLKVDFHWFLRAHSGNFYLRTKRGNINVKVEHRSVYVSARHIIHCLYFIDTRKNLARTYTAQNPTLVSSNSKTPPLPMSGMTQLMTNHGVFTFELPSPRWDKSEWRKTHAYYSLNLNLIMP